MSSSTTARTRHARQLAADEASRAASRRRALLLMTGGALLIGLVVVGAALLLGRGSGPALPSIAAYSTVFPGVPQSGHVLGSEDAPVTLDVYEDFQCPACLNWTASVLPGLVQGEVTAGTVRIVAHDNAFIGPESILAGRAAWAAEQQGRFWDYDIGLYRMQGAENSGVYTEASLTALAGELGLDLDQFGRDLNSNASLSAVQKARDEAQAKGISSTPTVLLNGVRQQNSSLDSLRAAIAALAGS